ncbi:discoidin domain-containing protein [Paenibacillus sp. EKM102P]|uniref:discoidin domain-containing protein n=1 Tax=unclassified Paenibacillus TaxID=185978 RepID=UPI00142D815C|nr:MULTISPECIES: discoidin domain-containing protein [unclassified Paenibacillus]KAF6620411.1 discoidin domain-containing protein [Paenibacillus sp. EKM101P]KAF6623403.1 discoidin domain-containing protein [Paenibacillus sp. EKM102P]KAF6634035.1 discoidin domain-containing protein [Paenibacillus sp. EKM10P]KAF6649561.1 discoidin domain-containing protein [Paenibacillus sp. EKM11P]
MYLKNVIPSMTSNTAPSGVVSATSVDSTFTDAWMAFDGNTDTIWKTGRGINKAVIQYTFAKAQNIKKYTIVAGGEDGTCAPKNWTFEGSNDGGNWTVLDTQTDQTNWAGGVWGTTQKREYNFQNDNWYSNYRLNITQNNGMYYYLYIYEIEMLAPEYEKKYLIYNNNKYKVFDGSNFVDANIAGQKPTEEEFLNSGMNDISGIPESAWQQLQDDVELCYYTDDPYKLEAQFTIETTPFTLAEEWQDKEINIIEYTDNPQQTESSISLETEPFILYDELGDNVDVLYYTDELTKTTASLEYNANYSPVDDIHNNFEVVTWTDESNNPFNLSLGALPVGQFIKQSNDFTLPGSLQAITILKSASDNAKFLLSFDSGLTWKAYRYGKWIEVIVDDLNIIKKQAMSYKEISKLVESDFKNQGDKVRFGYYIEDKLQESLNPTKIDATQLAIKANVDDTKFQNLSFYVLNTEATIQISFNSGKILGQVNDEDKGKVQYRVLLNDLPYFPNDGSFTRLAPSPVDINLNISERDMFFDKDNKLRVEFKDYWGNTDYWQTTFAGTYTGLMFMDESGEYLSDTFGGILKYLDFGMIFAGQTTLDQKVVIKNQLGYPIDNLLLEVNKEKLPEGVTIELSRTQSPFLATDYITYGLTKPLETQEFYVRIVADIEAKPVPNGIFELKINSNKVVV